MTEVVMLVPVKPLAVAKSRLRVGFGERTPDLVMAMAADVVQAAVACSTVTEVRVITNDFAVAQMVRAIGAIVIPDHAESGLNEALRAAADQVRSSRPHAWLISQPADCPATGSDDIADLVAAVVHSQCRSFVSDASGTGTTALVAPAGCDLNPGYGPGSAATHRRSGAQELTGPRWQRMRRDVDTAADLIAAQALGVGPSTAAWLQRHWTTRD